MTSNKVIKLIKNYNQWGTFKKKNVFLKINISNYFIKKKIKAQNYNFV